MANIKFSWREYFDRRKDAMTYKHLPAELVTEKGRIP